MAYRSQLTETEGRVPRL